MRNPCTCRTPNGSCKLFRQFQNLHKMCPMRPGGQIERASCARACPARMGPWHRACQAVEEGTVYLLAKQSSACAQNNTVQLRLFAQSARAARNVDTTRTRTHAHVHAHTRTRIAHTHARAMEAAGCGQKG